jgi:hypothetical protein
MRAVLDRNPELNHILNDPATLRQTFEVGSGRYRGDAWLQSAPADGHRGDALLQSIDT